MTDHWTKRAVSPEDAVALIKSGDTVFIHGAAATPTPLIDAMVKRKELENVRLFHIHLEGKIEFGQPEYDGIFRSNSLFTGAALRDPIAEGRADFTPVFLSDIPRLFALGRVPLDVAVIQVSPPDKHGYCTLGTSVDTALAAAKSAKIVIAEINEQMPRTRGNTLVPLAKIAAFVHSNRELPAHDRPSPTPEESAIGDHIAKLIPDGGTLQMGIGAIPDAVLLRLFDKNDLGIHTEMFSDGVIDLVQAGVITNRRKNVHNGRITTSFAVGSKRLFEFCDDNPFVEFYPCDHTNDTAVIRRNDNVVAINSAIEVDLSGQVVSDSFGHRIYSGIGGQMDFIRGAALSKGGVPIIALPSTAARGTISRLTPTLKPGAGVVTSRGHVNWVVTEFGAVNLWGRNLRERAEMLISISHPDFRQQLTNEICGLRHFSFNAEQCAKV
jgi:4-hydroxybutyrate CoA-transferase